jgi:hypothetical protein
LANLRINRACDVEPPGHVQKRVRYGRQGVAIRRDQADQVRRIGFGQRNPDQTVIWQQKKSVRHDARPVTEAQMPAALSGALCAADATRQPVSGAQRRHVVGSSNLAF